MNRSIGTLHRELVAEHGILDLESTLAGRPPASRSHRRTTA